MIQRLSGSPVAVAVAVPVLLPLCLSSFVTGRAVCSRSVKTSNATAWAWSDDSTLLVMLLTAVKWSYSAVIAGGLYLLPDTMIVTSWGTAPCITSRLTRTYRFNSLWGLKEVTRDKQTVRPLWGHEYFWRLIWNASKLSYLILTWLLRHITRKL